MTIFKKILSKEIPAKIVHEDEICTAFYDVSPQAPIHILIIPNKEIISLEHVRESDKNTLGHMLVVTAQIAKKLGVEKDGFRVVINTNSHGGQSVYHLHMHLLAGRQLSWPPG